MREKEGNADRSRLANRVRSGRHWENRIRFILLARGANLIINNVINKWTCQWGKCGCFIGEMILIWEGNKLAVDKVYTPVCPLISLRGRRWKGKGKGEFRLRGTLLWWWTIFLSLVVFIYYLLHINYPQTPIFFNFPKFWIPLPPILYSLKHGKIIEKFSKNYWTERLQANWVIFRLNEILATDILEKGGTKRNLILLTETAPLMTQQTSREWVECREMRRRGRIKIFRRSRE